jgi:hypothetical protein
VRLLVLALVASCGSSEPVADCSQVSQGVKKYWTERATETSDPDELAAIGETSKAAAEKLERHCVADHWNADMITCTRAVFRLDDSGCMKFLSTLQRQKLQAADEAPKVHGGIGIGN